MAYGGRKLPLSQLTSSISIKGSDDDLIVYCQPCDRDGPRLAPYGYCKNCCEHLCQSCFQHHKKHTLSRDHILLDETSMPETLQQPPMVHFQHHKKHTLSRDYIPLDKTSVVESLKQTPMVHSQQHDAFTRPCPKHKKEVIKFFCNNHKALICNVCVALDHQSYYCNVNYIPDISENVIDLKENQNLLKTIQSISIRCNEMKENVNKAYQKSNTSLKNVLRDINEFRKEINQRIDELEMQAEGRVNDILHENSVNLQKVETACNDVTSILQTSSDTIKQLITSKQSDELFIEVKFAEQMIKDYEKILTDLANSDVKEYDFKNNEIISASLTKDKSLGTLIHKSVNKRRTAASQVKSSLFSYRGEICVKTTKDEKFCNITGMTFLTPDLLIIADNHNKAVKMVETCSRSVTDQLQLTGTPHDITKVTSVEVAVTLPYAKEIQFISVIANKLTQSRNITMCETCYGISCHQDKLVVSFEDPEHVKIIDLNGTVLKTFGNGFFKHPYYVVTNSRSIYVSDCKKETVTKLNWHGEVNGIYSDKGFPRGLVVLADGAVFVSDQTENNIREISEDCSTGEVVLQNLKTPLALCWCTDTNELYHSCDSKIPKNNNALQMYKLS